MVAADVTKSDIMAYDVQLCKRLFQYIKRGYHNCEDIVTCMKVQISDMIHVLFHSIAAGFIKVHDMSIYNVRIELDPRPQDSDMYPQYERSGTYINSDLYVNPVCRFLKRPLLNKMNAAYSGYVAFMAHYKHDDGVHADITWIHDHSKPYASSVVDLLIHYGVASENVKDPDYESTFHKVDEVYITSSYDDLIHAIMNGYIVIGTINVYGHSFNEILAGRSNVCTYHYDYHIGYCVIAGCMVENGLIGCIVPWSCTDILWLTQDYINKESYVWYIIK